VLRAYLSESVQMFLLLMMLLPLLLLAAVCCCCYFTPVCEVMFSGIKASFPN